MRHVENALIKMKQYQNFNTSFINIENKEDIKGVPPIVSFTIQSDPIGEVGVNGCQALDMLEYTKCLFESLNDVFPCRENALTITKIEEAIHWQEARTKDRINKVDNIPDTYTLIDDYNNCIVIHRDDDTNEIEISTAHYINDEIDYMTLMEKLNHNLSVLSDKVHELGEKSQKILG